MSAYDHGQLYRLRFGATAPAEEDAAILWLDTSTTPPTPRAWDGATWVSVASSGAHAHAASAVTFAPSGSIAATDVQAAIEEVRDEAAARPAPLDPTTAEGDLLYRRAHAATAVPVGFIGDSITAGEFTTTPAPTLAAADLSGHGLTVTAVNQGYNGAKAADWVPGATAGYLATAYTAFATAGVRLVHVMLGTNEAAQGDATATWRANMVTLLADLTLHGYLVVLTDPPASTDSATNTLLVQQQPERDALANGVTILRGDTRSYDYFLAHPSQLTGAGLHPDDTGTPVMAQYWADALAAPVHALASQLALSALPVGAEGRVLTVVGGYPAWATATGGGGGELLVDDNGDILLDDGPDVLYEG